MAGEISVINTIDTAHENMIVSYCYRFALWEAELSYTAVLFIWSIIFVCLYDSYTVVWINHSYYIVLYTYSMTLRWITLVRGWLPAPQTEQWKYSKYQKTNRHWLQRWPGRQRQNNWLSSNWMCCSHEGPVWQVAWAHPKYGSILASCSYDRKVHYGTMQCCHSLSP